MSPPRYGIIFSREARSFIDSASPALRKQVGFDLFLLQQDPKRSGVIQLEGLVKGEVAYRFRSGDYRIAFTIREQKILVYVLKIGHRREVYR